MFLAENELLTKFSAEITAIVKDDVVDTRAYVICDSSLQEEDQKYFKKRKGREKGGKNEERIRRKDEQVLREVRFSASKRTVYRSNWSTGIIINILFYAFINFDHLREKSYLLIERKWDGATRNSARALFLLGASNADFDSRVLIFA